MFSVLVVLCTVDGAMPYLYTVVRVRLGQQCALDSLPPGQPTAYRILCRLGTPLLRSNRADYHVRRDCEQIGPLARW